MKYFSRDWNKIKETLSSKKHIALFLDFDGTLTPIRKKPQDVTLNLKVRRILKNLADLKNVSLAIISGRELKDVKRLVGIPQLTYAGNHGLEVKSPKFSFVKPQAKRIKPVLAEIAKKLKKQLKSFPGIIVENKQYSLSIHYRLLPFFKIDHAEKILRETVEPYLAKKKVVLTAGKKVWEVRSPVLWNKGEVVQWILKKIKIKAKGRIIPFYFGDDITDEDAFASLKSNGYTIRVGYAANIKSNAKYYLRSPAVVYLFLEELYEVLKEAS